jgi:hypothetical protein
MGFIARRSRWQRASLAQFRCGSMAQSKRAADKQQITHFRGLRLSRMAGKMNDRA